MTEWLFDIDIVGGCNLRCPSCPVGNSNYKDQPQGFMSPDLLERIVAKAVDECGRPVIGLYNWTEPFLHPNLAEMIRTVNKFGVPCGISTNLNVLRHAQDVLAAEPRYIRVSVSGFRQENYGQTHRRGDIEKVKAGMAELAAAKRRTGSNTTLKVIFHRYLGNHEDEALMRDYAQSLGFGFDVVWAYMMPAEKNVIFAEEGRESPRLTRQDREVIDRLALPLDEALSISRDYVDKDCLLRASRISITHDGGLMLCCGVFDQSQFRLGGYLDLPLAEIQRLRYAHDYCGPCMTAGVHALASYIPGERFDEVALANVKAHYPNVQLTGVLARNKKSIISRVGKRLRSYGRRVRQTYKTWKTL